MLMARRMEADRESYTDQDILFRLVDEDIEAFGILVARYKNRLINFVYRFVKDTDMAEDIVQETFLRVYRHRKEYKAIANFSTWIFTIAGNLAKSELRRRKRWRFLSMDAGESDERKFELPDTGPRPDRVASGNILEESLTAAIDSLHKKYKEALILRDVEGMNYKQISEITGVPVGTVKSRVNRARRRLQRKLVDHTPSDELF